MTTPTKNSLTITTNTTQSDDSSPALDAQKFESIGAVIAWFDDAFSKLAVDDHDGRAQLKKQGEQEIRKIYARWEKELQKPMSAGEKAELMEDFQLLTMP